MNKFKKVAASLAAVATISALSVSAAAYSDYSFSFSLSSDSGGWATDSQNKKNLKEDSDGSAVVHAKGGNVTSSKPIYATIYSKKTPTPNNAYRVSGTVALTSNSQDATIYYTDSVYQNTEYFLRGETGAYYAYINGNWNP